MLRTGRTVILGAGNILCSDDGVGVHAARRLQDLARGGAEVVDAGTAVWHALSFVEGAARVLVIDAVQAGGAPGTVYEFDGYAAQERAAPQSLHSVDLAAAVRLLPDSGRPAVFRVIGVEPASLACGADLSPSVREALPAAVEAARRLVSSWLEEDPTTQPAAVAGK